MDGTNCNTYQNKYNKSNLTDSKSRYYYNLTAIKDKFDDENATPSDGEKLLFWSLNKYAASNINSSNFTNSFGTGAITGTFNMEHLSYYPIDVDSAVTIGNATFQFYNDKIEASEGGTGNADSGVRTTRGASQHYLMHNGVFRNVSSTLTTSGNIHFKGSIGVDSTYSGALINGALSGTLTTNDSKEIVFEGLTISDTSKYLFINNNLKARVAAGGIIGSNNEDRYIQNCKVEKCVIDVGTGASTANNTPCGGIVGQMNSGTLYGYNIEVKDCDFLTHQWADGAATNTQKAYTYTDENDVTHNPVSGMKCGNFVGNGNSKIVNLTAVHSENNPAATDFNSTASSSFIIYADYNDVASGDDKGTKMSTLSTLPAGYENVGEGGLKDYFPNVNVSPVVDMGTNTILTSDGAALYDKVTSSTTTPTPVIDAIVNESGSNYNTTPSEVKTYIQNALLSTTVEGQPNKISTYKTEMGSLPDGVDDFTVLVINSEYIQSSTALINDYIQMVTNTNYDYYKESNWTNKCNINVYPCTYNGTKYVINAQGKRAGLEMKSVNGVYSFFMRNTHADSNQGDFQFSLMDVQFYNPNTTLKEVVYHLYIPVLTKKMLLFEFKSASQQGTDNKYANFANYANTLAESLESWYTAYLNFSYGQTEINSMLESGAGLNWNGAKTILFKYQTDTVAAKLSSDTQLVLCD